MRLKTFDQFVCLILIHFVNVNPKKNLSFVFRFRRILCVLVASWLAFSLIFMILALCFFFYLAAHRFFYKTQEGYKEYMKKKETNKARESERERGGGGGYKDS